MQGPIVDIEWLSAHRHEIVLADVRWYLDGSPGAAAYERGHIPGAVYVELEDVLAAPADPGRGRHPMPDPETFAQGLGAAGIGEHDTVIAYDDAGGVIAARLVWMLRAIGASAALLDGGLAAWSGSLESGPAIRRRARFTARPWPVERLAGIDEVAAISASRPERPGSAVLVDARDRVRYAGGPDPVDPRSGHIPGARNAPARENLGADGRMREVAELRRRYGEIGIANGADVIAYCGSGVTACHDLLAIEHAGLGAGRLFPGSWSQWSRDPERPIETG